jgi:ureidoacrylate peracid hydrolase
MSERADEAVVVIDMQNNLCHPDGAFTRQLGFDMVAFAAALDRAVVLVRAARAAGVPVIQTRAEFLPDYADAGVVLREVLDERMKASRSLVAGSWQTQIADELGPAPTDYILPKNRSSAFFGTQLEPLLRSLGVRRLTICGVSASCCVESTARDAVERGYDVTVAGDATAELTAERCAFTLRTLAEHFCRVASVDEISTAWSLAPLRGEA